MQDLYNNKICHKEAVGLDFVTTEAFSKELDDQIDIIVRKCHTCTYHFTDYRQLLISKGVGKPPRCISIPTIRDKLVLSALNEIITGVYDKAVITPMPQVLIQEITDVINSKQFNTYIKLDIKSFYASINHKKLLKKVRAKIRKHQIYTLIEKAIKTETHAADTAHDKAEKEKGIPEGLSISNALANLYLKNMDEHYSKEKVQFRYWRYVDDILLLTTKEYVKTLECRIKSDIKKLDLEIEETKTKSAEIHQGFEYLGYRISDRAISVRKSTVIKLERAIEDVFRQYKRSQNPNKEYLTWKINLKATGFILENYKYGWVFFYSQIDTLESLFHLDWFVQKMSDRYDVNDVSFKRFARAYHEIRNALHETGYIPNLDTMSADDRRKIVKEIYGENTDGKDDEWINRRFRLLMKREIRDIQKDVQPFS